MSGESKEIDVTTMVVYMRLFENIENDYKQRMCRGNNYECVTPPMSVRRSAHL